MSEFSDLQARIKEATTAVEVAKQRIFLAREKAKSLDVAKAGVARGKGPRSDEFRALEREQQEIERSIAAERSRLDETIAGRDRLFEAFRPFADPRENLSRLPSAHPILLFPVRLETRFKVIRGREGADRNQLWVRIFPDECSIDTFDEVLSASEVTRARVYWTALWKAGTAGNDGVKSFVQDKRRGAWRTLMGLFNAGRAYWITTKYRPTNEAAVPSRTSVLDRILVIPTDGPPDAATQDALEVYWEAVTRAAGDQASIDTAFATLTAAAGGSADAAQALVATFVPQNIGEYTGPVPAGAAVKVVFLLFDPAVSAKNSAWSQAAKVRTFPERFVLLGYQGNDAPPVIEQIGERVPNPLILGPDTRDDIETLLADEFGPGFVDLPDEEKATKYVEYLAGRSETRWMFDFDQAVAMGLGFRVDLTAAQARAGFTRLMVLGITIGADSETARKSLEELLRNHQFGDSGFGLLPQGTPTNNTEDAESGQSELEDSDEAFDRYFPDTAPEDPTGPGLQRDGRRLAELLGIDPQASALPTAEHYLARDQIEAEAMHTALWNATLGFYLESMTPPLATPRQREQVRFHLVNHVKGRGAVPAIRIGKQPYGILPISNLKSLEWLTSTQFPVPRQLHEWWQLLQTLYEALKVMRADWQSLTPQVAHVGKGGDAHEILLQALGLHAGSVEFDRRIAQSFDHLKNMLYLQHVLGDEVDNLGQSYKARGMQLLERLGYVHDAEIDPEIPILTRSFLAKQEDVTKPLIDDQPLSEERRIRDYTDAGENYVEWLIRYAKSDHGKIRREEGFTENKKPGTILYEMLRHAVNLEFGNASIRLHERAAILTSAEAEVSRLDAKFIGVQVGNTVAESRWDMIYRQEPRIAAQGMVVDHIVALLRDGIADDSISHLADVLTALERLKDTPTARLERCLVEHLDCCHYRLDAWLLSLLNAQLQLMRGSGPEGAANRGIYLGAFGWVENLKSDNRVLQPASLDELQQETFDPDNERLIVIDSGNAGYQHAPSTAHALTAAVMRNAYISTASQTDAEQYRVNLSSERVRMALSIIEGMQQGQGLAELLGYRLERGLHDNNTEELDIFIYELRKVFPLVSNRLNLTAIRTGRVAKNALEATRFAEEGAEFNDAKAVTKVEARNVVNGLALLDHIKKTNQASYPFGFPVGPGVGQLRAATTGQRDAIDAEVRQLMNVRDAVADLALAESVHQAVQGNYERAAGALDAYSKGGFPQIPDVIQSPASGRTLTHRFGIHLPSGVLPAAGSTPRAKAEPALAAWLRDLMPAANTIACTLRFRVPVAEGQPPNPWTPLRITLLDLGLEPIDLLYLHDAESARGLSALDDHVLRHFRSTPRRLDLELALDYTTAQAGDVTLFELGALLAEVRAVAVAARPLEASDIELPNEGSKTQNTSAEVRPDRITTAKAIYDAALAGLQNDFIGVIDPLVDFEDVDVGVSNLAAIAAAIDARSDQFVQHMGTLSLFGMNGAGGGFVHERKRSIDAAFRQRVVGYLKRWADFDARYQALITVDLPAAGTEEARITVLQKAEALVSTSFTTTFTDAANLETIVQGKKTLFDAKRTALTNFLSSPFLTLAALRSAATALVGGLDAFDKEPLEFEDDERMFVILVEDMLKQAQKVHALGTKNSLAVQDLLDDAGGAPPVERLDAMKKAAALLFGESFRLVPEFRLSAERALEVQNCLNDQSQLLSHQTTTLDRDFPVDEWLYGVARVREKLGAWENLVMLAEGLKARPAMDLTPLQLPYRPDDHWLAVEHPSTHVVESDTLLYTAFAPAMNPAGAIVGLLVDEWTETIPAKQETTALTFHYDRPNCEAPQSMLLVTPSTTRGVWTWQEVVASLHEALDLARLRAVEPDQLDQLDYARFLPATVATWTFHPVTFAINYGALAKAVVNG